jgi:hypothetical protein
VTASAYEDAELAEVAQKLISKFTPVEVRGGAVWLDEEDSFASGNLCTNRGQIKIDSGRVRRSESDERTATDDTFAFLKAAIKRSFDAQTPSIGLSEISVVWAGLDEVAELAEARTRILLKRVASLPLGNRPSWLDADINEIKKQRSSLPETVEKLILALLASKPELADVRPSIVTDSLGRIEIEWESDTSQLRWIVSLANAPWPIVHVYVMLSDSDKQTVKICHTASDVVDMSKRINLAPIGE